MRADAAAARLHRQGPEFGPAPAGRSTTSWIFRNSGACFELQRPLATLIAAVQAQLLAGQIVELENA
jgi:hypothetical protein